jgi:hypothetical protein
MVEQQSWDPVAESIRAQIAESYPIGGLYETTKVGVVLSKIYMLLHATQSAWISLVLRSCTVGLLAGAGTVAAFGRPLWGSTATSDLSGMVATAAGAIAFTGTIFTAIALPMTVSSSLPGGFSGEVLRRPLPWATGIITVLLTTGLFALSASKPTPSGALFASLMTGTVFGLVWVASRSLLEGSDHYHYARRQAGFMRAQATQMRRTLHRSYSLRLRKHLRTPETIAALLEQPERQVLHGMVRHQRAAFRHYCTQGRATEALELFGAMIHTVRDYATDRDGAIGPSLEISETLLSTLDEVITADMRGVHDEIVLGGLHELLLLSTAPFKHVEFNALPSLLMSRLEEWLERVWGNDQSGVPNRLAKTVGDLTVHAIAVNETDGAFAGIDLLGRLCYLSEMPGKAHISMATYPALLAALKAIAAKPSPEARNICLEWWSSAAQVALSNIDLARISKPHRLLVPGFSLEGIGLQGVMWKVPQESLIDIAGTAGEWLQPTARGFMATDSAMIKTGLTDCFALYYFLAYVCAARVTDTQSREELGTVLLVSAIEVLADQDRSELTEIMRHDDFTEMLWSLLLAVGYLTDNYEKVTEAARILIDRFDWESISANTRSGFRHAFCKGLLILAETHAEDLARLSASGPGTSPLSGPLRRWGNRRPGLGNAPAATGKRILCGIDITNKINAWAAEKYPALAQPH